MGLDPNYVMDEMLTYEIQPLIDSMHNKNKESWELTRLISYIIALVNSTKKLKMNDIMTLPWDNDNKLPNTQISNNDITRLREKANKYINKK